MKRTLTLAVWLGLVAIILTGCGGVSSSPGSGGSADKQAQVFVTGEDAPLPSVVSFYITINSITLNSSTSAAVVLSQPTTVDFGRLMGMRSLLGFNKIAAGTYTSATFKLASPVIYYVDMSTTPPTTGSIKGTLTKSTITVAFPTGSPLTVDANGLAGLHMDFDLRRSLAVDGGGQITGSVSPTIDISAVSATEATGQITDFTGSVVSVNTSANTFVMQGPYGFREVIATNSKTQFNGSYTLGNLPANAVVSVVGTVQANGSILASAAEVVTTSQAFISGRILAVSPGPTVTMFVGEELPNLSPTIPVDSVYSVDLSLVGTYDVCFFDNWFTQQLFNGTSLVVGQRIFVGGTFQSGAFTPAMVSLRPQGVLGTLVEGSAEITNPTTNRGSFEMTNDLLLSYSAGGPFVVNTGSGTAFANVAGLAGLQSAGSANLVVRGLVFQDPNTLKPVVWAGWVGVLP